MRYAVLIFSAAIVLGLSAGAEAATKSNRNAKVLTRKENTEKLKIPSVKKDSSRAEHKQKFEIREENSSSEKALRIIQQLVVSRPVDRSLSQDEVFHELRNALPETEFSSEELMILIDDAMEIKKKYLLIFDFVVRSEYARRAVKEGIKANDALQFASSEYVQLPRFILRDNVDDYRLDDVLSDLGCGVIWKDRAKYSFVRSKYFGKGETKIDVKGYSPKIIRNYLKLIAMIDEFFEKTYSHLVYLIAQDFCYALVPPKKIQKIFSFSDEELKSLIKPNNYERI